MMKSAGTLLLVEDDEVIGEATQLNLERYDYQVTWMRDGLDAWRAFSDRSADDPFQIVVCDVMLPGLDGISLCRRIRDAGNTPVVMISARTESIDIVYGLDAGADDYVTKPFDFEELQARIRAVLRRARQMVVRITLGETLIDFRAFKAVRGRHELRLSRREFDLLSYLAEREGAVVPRSELLREVWGFPDEPSTRAVDYAIRRLRRKIERDPHNPQHIHTVHGDGYCLTFSGH
jgi:DNA-binding response OmpR family regulator